MIIGGTRDVISPSESPYAYSAEWRHEAACALKETGDICSLLADDDVFAQMKYLTMMEDRELEGWDETLLSDKSDTGQMRAIVEANNLYSSPGTSYTKDRIEALLLCPELDYTLIARAFGVAPESIEMYQKLFYNIRDDDGKLFGRKGFLIYCALKGAQVFLPTADIPATNTCYWRVLAFEGGYKPLYSIWGWTNDEELPEPSISDMAVDMLRNVYRHLDRTLRFNPHLDIKAIAQILSTLSEQLAELRKEGILSDKEVVTEKSMILQFIGLFQPVMGAGGAGRMEAAQKELEQKLQSDHLQETDLEL